MHVAAWSRGGNVGRRKYSEGSSPWMPSNEPVGTADMANISHLLCQYTRALRKVRLANVKGDNHLGRTSGCGNSLIQFAGFVGYQEAAYLEAPKRL